METKKITEKFENYLELKRLSPGTITIYLCHCKIFFKKYKIFNQESVEKYLRSKNKKHDVPRAFVTNYFECFNINIKLPKMRGKKKKLPKVLTKQEIQRIIDEMLNTQFGARNRLIMMIMWEGALRISEVMKLTPMSFKWGKWLEDPKKSGELIVKGKYNKERIVYLKPAIMNQCLIYTRVRLKVIKKNELLFPIGIRRVRNLLYAASKKVLGYRINPHAIRHSRASYLLSKGFDIKELSEYLGHVNLSTTGIYLHINREKLKEKFDEL